MRNFIISDLHGNGNIYEIIMGYLDNIYKEDSDISLYINGDLIDRGVDSASMLVDIRKRIINKKDFKIKYLAGNHELMMYEASLKRKNGIWPMISDWFIGNGGIITAYMLDELVGINEVDEIINFISNLDVYHKFEEKIDDKNIVLVHAKCPRNPKDICELKVKDISEVSDLLWARKDDILSMFSPIGNKDYFTIIGHTPVTDKYGYEYDEKGNYINIDGGCAHYALGYKEMDHVPLVEIDSKNNRLIILTFNNSNEIIYGNYFKDGKSILMSEEELNQYRKYLKKDDKTKKLENRIKN